MLKRKNKEIERLNNIIKEAREYIEEHYDSRYAAEKSADKKAAQKMVLCVDGESTLK